MDEPFPELFHRAQNGDAAAVDALLQRHLRALQAFVRLRSGPFLRGMESHSDLVQTVCREVLQDLASVRCDSEVAFRQWLYTVAHHKMLRKVAYHRAEKRAAHRRADLGEAESAALLDSYRSFASPSHHAGVREELERVEAAFDELPEEYREVLVQVCLLGQPYSALAEHMNRTESAVRKLVWRARARLGVLLSQD